MVDVNVNDLDVPKNERVATSRDKVGRIHALIAAIRGFGPQCGFEARNHAQGPSLASGLRPATVDNSVRA